jgi:hypothetical protein
LRELVFGWPDPAGTGKPAVVAILSQIEVLAESLAALDNLLQDKNLVINTALKQLTLSYAAHRNARKVRYKRIMTTVETLQAEKPKPGETVQ